MPQSIFGFHNRNNIILLLLLFQLFEQCKSPELVEFSEVDRYIQVISDSLEADRPEAALTIAQGFPKHKFASRENAKILFLKGLAYKALSKNDLSLKDFQSVLTILEQVSPGDDSLKAETFYQIGLTLARSPNANQSLHYQQAGLDMKIRLFTKKHISVIKSLNGLAGWYAGHWEYYRSLEIRKDALTIAKQLVKSDKSIEEIAKLYNNIGRLYFSISERELALQYYEEGLSTAYQNKEKFHKVLIILYLNLAELSIGNSNYEQALDYLEQADLLYCKFMPDEDRDYYWLTLGDIYKARGDLDLALHSYQFDLTIQCSKPTPNPRMVSVSHKMLAEVFYEMKNYDSCLYHSDQVLSLEEPLSGIVHVQNVEAYHLKALCFKAQGKDKEALFCFNKMLIANNYSGEMSTIVGYNHAIASFREIAILKSEQYRKERDLSLLKESLHYCELADEAVTYERRLLQASDSKEKFSESLTPLYETAVTTCETLYQLTKEKSYIANAFHFSERCKSLNLLEAIKSDNAALEMDIPKKWLTKENELKKEIQRLKSLRGNHPWTKDSMQHLMMYQTDQDIHSLLRSLDSLMQKYEDRFPNYFNLKYADFTIPASDIQAYCREERSTMLSYLFLKGKLYIFIIHPTGIDWEIKQIPANFDQVLNRFNGNISETPKVEASDAMINHRLSTLSEDAYTLYQLLIPFDKTLLEERLVIIPDDKLAYLPFAILLERPLYDSEFFLFNSWPYLIKHYSISYCYSASLLRQMEQKKHQSEPEHSFMGIAPDFSGQEWCSWIPNYRAIEEEDVRLQYNIGEIERLYHFLSKDDNLLLVGPLATRDKLMEYGGNYKILHFSTHAFTFSVKGENPFLALKNPNLPMVISPLYLWEVLHWRLNADLVVLSACKTGLGRFSKTEGLISLGQAFAYAGAKCIFPTLWSIKDSPSNIELMELFYENLCLGLSKDKAMQRAQLDFLEQEKSRSSAITDPHYWAAFSCIGDRAPMSL